MQYETMQLRLEIREEIEEAMKPLSFREREIIKLRYGLGDSGSHTLLEVGRIFKVTRERVRHIEAKALKKLELRLDPKLLRVFR
jgi:RNA polymerase primary sigma factor